MASIEAPVLATPTTLSGRIVRALSRSPLHIVLIGVALLWTLPTIGLAITSFRPRSDILSTGWWHAFGDLGSLTGHNYSLVLHSAGMGQAFLNSLYITIPATLLPLVLGSLAAFAFAWIPFPFRDGVFLLIVALMIVPIQMALVPLLKLFNDWQLNKPHLGIDQLGFVGIWFAHTAFGLPLAIFLLRNFFITLPKDLVEAARIDGASNFEIFRRIVIPLSVPALASYGIFQFLWVWNDLLMALVLIGDPHRQPMTVKITTLLSTYGVEFHLLAAAAFLLMIVPLIVFFSLQRYFVQGLLAGSVKT
ncbi:MAG TPA: carbohydrate ABC transporter permease [Gaiellaceae bacterium]|nr:carbohydrate ABC transporter permease [Gaiellaceae bacterium]